MTASQQPKPCLAAMATDPAVFTIAPGRPFLDLIRSLCGAGTEVPSPSFNIVLTYDAPQGTVWHFDLYRIADPRELDELGLDEALQDGIALIEWPDRLGEHPPSGALTLRLAALDTPPTARRADLIGNAEWAARLSSLPVSAHV